MNLERSPESSDNLCYNEMNLSRTKVYYKKTKILIMYFFYDFEIITINAIDHTHLNTFGKIASMVCSFKNLIFLYAVGVGVFTS